MTGKGLLVLFCVVASGDLVASKAWLWKSPMPQIDARGIPRASHNVRNLGEEEDAVPHWWAHQASLFIDSMYFCAGALISDQWVLTAAHCLDGAVFINGYLGVHNVQDPEESQVIFTSTDFYVHQDFNAFLIKNDIAAIKLPQPIQFNEYIRPVKLPASDVTTGTIVTPTGWTGNDRMSTLRQADVSVINNDDCNDVFGNIDDDFVCVVGQGFCHSNSGGPLNHHGLLYGVASFGASAGCEAGYPAVFTRVHFFLDWILQTTGVGA